MDILPVEIIGIILSYANFNLTELVQLKKTCRKFNHALNSPKLAHLYYGKYAQWWYHKVIYNNFEVKNKPPKVVYRGRAGEYRP